MSEALIEEFERIKHNHGRSLRATGARVVLAPSVLRVFEPGTKRALMPLLEGLEVDHLSEMDSQADYRQWFESRLSLIADQIREMNPHNPRIYPGYKWGHAAKILNLYNCYIVLNTRYFPDRDAERISYWLYLPIDSIVMNMLTWLGVKLPFSQIKEIDSPEKFYYVQDWVGEVAAKVGMPRIWFDDVWSGERTFGKQLELL